MLDPLDVGPITPKSARFARFSAEIDHSDRGRSVMIDPFAFMPASTAQRWQWDTRGRELFYHVCGDPDQAHDRSEIDWPQVVYCDYKLFEESRYLPAQRQCLDSWLGLTDSMKLLHVSVDEPGASARDLLQLLDPLTSRGPLIIQIYDRTGSAVQERDLYMIRDLFNSDDILALDYNLHPVNCSLDRAAWCRDLKDLDQPRIDYTVYKRRQL